MKKSMPTPEETKERTARVYNAAADNFDQSALSFWDYFGRKTVENLALQIDAQVLDVCCGSGASAIPAAETIGPSGLVVGIDLADKLLELGRAKAERRLLKNILFHQADMLALPYPDESFDVVICVFGIFFVPDMSGAVRELWRFVRPGGKLAITTWGRDVFEPANSAFWQAIGKVRPELNKAFRPWDQITDPDQLRQMLNRGGINLDEVITENRWHPLPTPDDWWKIIMGTGYRGYRGTIEQLSSAERAAVRETSLAFIRDQGIDRLSTSALYAVATKKE
jgi:ubiquinone/menaquinone biosynthesis C-methylase UbiE